MLDTSRLAGTGSSLYCTLPTTTAASSSSSSSSSDVDGVAAPPAVVDVVLTVEWSSAGRLIRIVDREDAEAVAAHSTSASSSRGSSSASTHPLLGKQRGKSKQSIAAHSDATATAAADSSASSLSFSMDFASIGVSVVGDTPYGNCRRELFSLYVQDMHVEQIMVTAPSAGRAGAGARGHSCLTSFVLTAADLQIDNYSETVVFPVMFRRDYSSPRAEDKQNKNKSPLLDACSVPFLRLSYVLETFVSTEGLTGQSCYHDVTANLMPFCFEIDSGTIQLLWEDFFSKSLHWFSVEEALCAASPSEWAMRYKGALRWPWQRQGALVDMAATKARSLQAKCLYEQLKIHPIKVRSSLVFRRLMIVICCFSFRFYA